MYSLVSRPLDQKRRRKGLLYNACTCASSHRNNWENRILQITAPQMCYHGDLVHARALCTGPFLLLSLRVLGTSLVHALQVTIYSWTECIHDDCSAWGDPSIQIAMCCMHKLIEFIIVWHTCTCTWLAMERSDCMVRVIQPQYSRNFLNQPSHLWAPPSTGQQSKANLTILTN